jgi:hypothetical protein
MVGAEDPKGRRQEKAATIHMDEEARSFIEKVLKEVKG